MLAHFQLEYQVSFLKKKLVIYKLMELWKFRELLVPSSCLLVSKFQVNLYFANLRSYRATYSR